MTAACPACVDMPPGGEASANSGLQFSLPTIHCAACIGKVERGLNAVPGVGDVRVNLSLKRLSVTGPVDPARVLSTLENLGFEAHPLDPETLNKTRDEAGRKLLTRLAVAGFAMMNVMLLSVAVWSGAPGATRDLFHLISAGIALPVVVYSAQPFFVSAWSALRVRRLNMDVPISLAIILASGMSLFETFNSGEHAYFDAALSLTFFLLIGRYMDHRTRSAARSAAKELAALEEFTAQRLQATRLETVPVSALAIGDVVQVAAGARVPVDGTLLSAEALMDRSFLTGESAAVPVSGGVALQAGEVNLSGPILLRATAVGEDTTLRRMAAMVETAENGRNSYTALADKAAQIYAPVVHLLSFVAFLAWFWATGDVRHALNIAIAVLIITCPCALGLAVPAASIAAVSRLYANGFLVKHATALERLAEVDHVVFDKTGTLTTPAVRVPESWSPSTRQVAKALAQASLHPMARALNAALGDTTAAQLAQVEEHKGQGISADWEGVPVKLGRGGWLGASFEGFGLALGDADPMPIAAHEALRPGVAQAVADIALPAEVLTGDAEIPARRIAAQLSLPVRSGVSPEEKLAHLTALAAEGRKVLMVGDGLNDTTALAAAHASIAPAKAMEASRSAADVIVISDSFDKLPLILRVARATRRISKQNFAIAAAYNCIAIPVALAGFATPLAAALAMSTSSITVLLNAQRLRSIK